MTMSREVTITMNAQITTVAQFDDAGFQKAMHYIDSVGGLEAWKQGVARETSEMIKDELPADDVVVSDIKWFEMEVEDTDEDSEESL
jgi:hypothetical protein